MIWVESTGDPVVTVEETAVPDWSGVHGGHDRACVASSADAVAFGETKEALVRWEHPDSEPTRHVRTENALRAQAPPGRYAVESADVTPDPLTCPRLHRLVPVTS